MGKFSHDGQLIYERFLAIGTAESVCFRKCFHSTSFPILDSNYLVNWCEIALAQLFDRLKLSVEALLIDKFAERLPHWSKGRLIRRVERGGLLSIPKQINGECFGFGVILNIN